MGFMDHDLKGATARAWLTEDVPFLTKDANKEPPKPHPAKSVHPPGARAPNAKGRVQ
jgi:hypothetical protein